MATAMDVLIIRIPILGNAPHLLWFHSHFFVSKMYTQYSFCMGFCQDAPAVLSDFLLRQCVHFFPQKKKKRQGKKFPRRA